MLEIGPLLLRTARTYGQRFFQRFGLHCATHQIRVILISCVVITSLFYPALSLYSSSKSVSIIDAFISPNAMSGLQQDLVDLWSGYPALRVQEDGLSVAKCGRGRVVRVERIFIENLAAEDDSALNQQILLSTLKLQNSMDQILTSRKVPCVKGPDGRCLVISPLAFWNNDQDALLADKNILDTLSLSRNISVAGIPVTPRMVLAGRGSIEPGVEFDFATFLALTYFFPELDCSSERQSWIQAVEAAANTNAELDTQEPVVIGLEYNPSSKNRGWSAISAFLYLAYGLFFVYVSWSMRQMNAVHSRIGLTFTALVEITVSTITSLSVCALVGFKITMVPWELLPLIIVFVGAENMFNLVDAVSKTSIALPVKVRIAEGLSYAGTSNTLKVVSYNSILGILAVFLAGPIRQFCVFAIVVLVAHWFLAHTFFITVLSIDIQRLELEELLRQDSSLAPAIPEKKPEMVSGKPQSKWESIVLATRKSLRGRATKNLSLFLLLAIAATLYYATLPSTRGRGSTKPPVGALSRKVYESHNDPAWRVWKTLNPKEAALLHLRLEGPTVLTFRPDFEDQYEPSDKAYRPRFSMRTLRLLFWLLKIMVLPIAATTSALWGLLRYLLKNAELLDAQRNKAEADNSVPREEVSALEREISFSTLPRVFDSDVELIAASKDGQVVVSVGLQNEIVIWNMGTQNHIAIDATDVLLRAASTSSAASRLTSVAVDHEGKYCAVGTGGGVIALWAIKSDGVHAFPHPSLNNSSAGVVDLRFSAPDRRSSRSSPPSSHPSSPVEPLHLFTIYDNGVVAKWPVHHLSSPMYIAPSSPSSVVRASLVQITAEEQLIVAFFMEDGMLELVEAEDREPLLLPQYCIQAGNPSDTVLKVSICRAVMADETRIIVAAATCAGAVSLWDGRTGEFILILDDAYGRVNQLCVSAVQAEACRYCGQLPLDSVTLTFSVDHVVRFFKAYINDETRRCTCAPTRPRKVPSWDNLARRSRSNSFATSGGSSSPLLSRRTLETPLFPVSGHGIHSRRASGIRESQSFPEDCETTVGPPETSKMSTNSVWHKTLVVRASETTCERGGWNIFGGKIVGIRRRPRIPQGNDKSRAMNSLGSSQGLSFATLDRWEWWTFDPSAARFQSSALSLLMTQNKTTAISSAQHVPRLPFTRVSPFVISRSGSLAGFGNTLGVFNFLS
ncbi:sterol regulatory element binding protein cleavage-activating protein [Mycena floridula]|nr:sterol regulatory element binding protein cleavage-activating protein [Mycena floridula]